MLKPARLAPGDRVAIVAPASPFEREAFDSGVAELSRIGFLPTYDDSVFAREGYVAGTPALRATALRTAWADPTIAGVMAARGGFGSVQLLPLLDRAEARRACKAFVGYSDLTSLLAFLTTTCGLVAFHGPMVAGTLARGAAGYDERSLRRCLTRAEPLGELAAARLETLQAGEATGSLLGGTLTQLVASLGTPYAFDPPVGYLLFLDEVDERPYRVDRMLTQLRLSGLLGRAAGVVFGELPGCDEPDGRVRIRAVVADLMRDFPGPVVFGLPSGHTRQPGLTLPLGVAARLVATERPRVIIEEAAVR
jgi:muramoyltetrapeptide carboxypeptidase